VVRTGRSHDPALVVDATSHKQGHPVRQVRQCIEVLHLPIGIKKGTFRLIAGKKCKSHHLAAGVDAISAAITAPQGAQVIVSVIGGRGGKIKEEKKPQGKKNGEESCFLMLTPPDFRLYGHLINRSQK
jgi:hypothetical protein